MQSVLQHRKSEQTDERSPEISSAAEDGCASQNYRGDGIQLITSAGVRAGLSEMRNVNNRSHTGDQAGENVGESNSLRNRNARVTRSCRRESDRVPRSPDRGMMEQDNV